MPRPGPLGDETRREVNAVLVDAVVERVRKEYPDYEVYLPYGMDDHRAIPQNLDRVAEYPSPAHPRVPAVHRSYFTWPQRETFSYTYAPLRPDAAAERAGLQIQLTQDSKGISPTRWVELTAAGGYELRDIWDMDITDMRPFTLPWPVTAPQVIEKLAREAVAVDDGRSLEEWMSTRPPDNRERLQELRRRSQDEGTEDLPATMFTNHRQDAWRLYRLLGPELYEPLTAQYRQPLSVELYAIADAVDRSSGERERLKAVGRELRSARRDLGLSVERVAELTALARARIIGGERGTGVLKVADLLVLADLYGMPAAELLSADPDTK